MASLSQTYTQSPVNERLERAKQMAQANSGTTNPEAVKQALAQETFSNDAPLNEAVQGQQDSVNALQQLAAYDQEVSQKYTQANQAQLAADNQRRAQTTQMGAVDGSSAQATINQGPASFDISTFAKPVVQDGGFLSPFVASGLTQGQGQATMDTYQLADTTRGARERYLGNEVSQMANLYQSEFEAEQERLRQEEAEKLRQFDLDMSYAEKFGGEVVDSLSGQSYTFKSPEERTDQLTQGERQFNELKNQALSDIQNWSTPRDLFAKYSGVLDFNELMTLYNANSPYGAANESMQELRTLYETAGGVLQNNKVDTTGTGSMLPSDMGAAARGKAASYEAFITNLIDVKNAINDAVGDKETGRFKDLGIGVTGFLSQFAGTGGTDKGSIARQKINDLQANVRNQMFGAALSEQEIKESKKVLPTTGTQEQGNLNKIDAKIQSKLNEYRAVLRSEGVPEDVINAEIQRISGGQMAQPSQGQPAKVGRFTVEVE